MNERMTPDIHTPARLARYATATAASPGTPPARRRSCLWHACTAQRTESALFCGKHAYAHRRAASSGKMPVTAELAEMRPSEIAAMTAIPKPPALIAVLAPGAPTPPRTCLWPSCGRPAPLRRFCPRCKARCRSFVQTGIIPATPKQQSEAAPLPALWIQYCYDLHLRRLTHGWPSLPPLEISATPITGCIIAGCGRPDRNGRGLCQRCYSRAKYRGEVARFPIRSERSEDT